MRVLYLTNIPAPYRVDFFNELSKYCELTVCFERTTALNREQSWYNYNHDFNAIFLKSINIGDESSISFEFIKMIKQEYDFIIIGGYSTLTGMISILYMKLKKINFILNSDGGFINYGEKKLVKKIKKFFISSASFWICAGSKTIDYLKYYGAVAENIYLYPFSSIKREDIIPNLLSVDQKRKIKKSLEIPYKYLIISIGQIIPRKGFDILIQKCKSLEDTGLYIIGGEETEELKKIRNEFNIKNVHYINFLDKKDLNSYYKAADLFVLLTREDIWGLVINEAMAKGLPVITTNKCGAGIEMLDKKMIVDLSTDFTLYISDDLQLEAKKNLDKAKLYTIETMAKAHYDILCKLRELK